MMELRCRFNSSEELSKLEKMAAVLGLEQSGNIKDKSFYSLVWFRPQKDKNDARKEIGD